MKAHYDTSDRDYYIFLATTEIQSLLEGKNLICDIYVFDDSDIFFNRRKLEMSIVPGCQALSRKYQQSTRKIIDFLDPILLEHGSDQDSIPYLLTLTKKSCEESLSPELLKRCGRNELRYGHGHKIHFYSNAGNAWDESNLLRFTIIENRWSGKYNKPDQ